jgi:putative FmdB family regulatory protein
MPIYEYECPQCGAVEEHLENLIDEPELHFCVCHGVMRRIISTGAFILKGDGWYKPSTSGGE